MKWKMAEKSMFAILLRSPWWVSIAIVVAFALVARAVLPEQYVVFGAMGGFPFLVIGVITAVKQFRALSPTQVANVLEALAAMNWRDFSGALERAYAKQGFAVSSQGDDTTDLVLTRDGRTTLVTGKRWKAANHGVEPLRALHKSRQARDASQCVYITLGDVGDKARRFAADNKVELLYGARLAQLLGELPARR